MQNAHKPIVFLIKASNLGMPRAKRGYCRTHAFCSYHSFKMCVNSPKVCDKVKITSHVPVMSHSLRTMKTNKTKKGHENLCSVENTREATN